PDPFSVPFPVRILFPVAVGGPLPFGCSDFIRIISADLIGFGDSDEESDRLRGIQFRQEQERL
ncbi:hypothetical protein, partial [Streptomyces sp. NPDC015131]|uniref:hypothetical protein n=1 Tax=Streptomyces sp. NPDC015131 TaxID=3364941 RepID=UPI0036F556FD